MDLPGPTYAIIKARDAIGSLFERSRKHPSKEEVEIEFGAGDERHDRSFKPQDWLLVNIPADTGNNASNGGQGG